MFAVASVTAVLVCSGRAMAHGGGYRGPVTVAPVSPGSIGSTLATPGLAAAAVPGATAAAGVDPTRWQAWWEFNKDAYLRVKPAVLAARPPTAHPTVDQIDREVLPALSLALRSTQQPDLASACLVALGKMAVDPAAPGVRELFVAALRDGTQETRETAALSLGIGRHASVLDDLVALVSDDGKGRKMVRREHVDERTRAFAAYGLGLVAEKCDDLALRGRVIDALRTVLQRVTAKDLDLALAAVHGIRLACPSPKVRSLAAWKLTQDAVDVLWRYATRRAGSNEQVVQSHALLAVAQVFAGDDSGVAAKYLGPLVDELAERDGRHAARTQSAALALGFLARPTDEEASAALRRLAQNGKDRQARSFALIALGQIGGDANRSFLLKTLAQGHKVTVKPWAALALGVLRHSARAQGSVQASEDATVGRALLEAMENVKAADARGAFAIALGLAGHAEAAPKLRALLGEHDREDEFAGYLGIGVALLGDQGAAAQLRDVAKRSLRRPQLLRQIAVAMGLLGDRTAGESLLQLLRAGDLNVATLGAVAGALGQIGDATSLAALTRMVGDKELPDLARAFAAAAVGGIADDDALPWNASLSFGVNYRAALPSLTDGLSGVLDIL